MLGELEHAPLLRQSGVAERDILSPMPRSPSRGLFDGLLDAAQKQGRREPGERSKREIEKLKIEIQHERAAAEAAHASARAASQQVASLASAAEDFVRQQQAQLARLERQDRIKNAVFDAAQKFEALEQAGDPAATMLGAHVLYDCIERRKISLEEIDSLPDRKFASDAVGRISAARVSLKSALTEEVAKEVEYAIHAQRIIQCLAGLDSAAYLECVRARARLAKELMPATIFNFLRRPCGSPAQLPPAPRRSFSAGHLSSRPRLRPSPLRMPFWF